MHLEFNIFYAHIHYLNIKFYESIRTENTVIFIEHSIACFLLKMFSRSWEIQAYIVKLGKIEKHTPQRAYKIIYNEAFTSK